MAFATAHNFLTPCGAMGGKRKNQQAIHDKFLQVALGEMLKFHPVYRFYIYFAYLGCQSDRLVKTIYFMEKTHKGKSPKQKGTSMSFYINDDIVQEVRKDAKDQKRSNSFIVNEILEEHYKQQGRLTD